MFENPILIIFAGANGSGKTTAAERFLKSPKALFTDFINTDDIARGLSPFKPEAARVSAGKIFFERFDDFIEQRKSFAFETTLSGSSHIQYINDGAAVYNPAYKDYWLKIKSYYERKDSE